MISFIVAFLISLIITLLLVRYQHLHQHISTDFHLEGIQKFHTAAVPRIGGMSVMTGLFAALWVYYSIAEAEGVLGLLLLMAAIPVFGAGFVEDLTKRVAASVRLFCAALSAALAGLTTEAWLPSVQILGIDYLMVNFPWISILLTCFCVAGVANSFNIIDGYNGLSAFVGAIILIGIACVATQLSDIEIATTSFAMAGALFGFLIFNYPRGLIFLGDGGAYLIGFWIAELSVLLITRHAEISKWFPLLLCAYPVFETIFTIFRRANISRTHLGMPDAEHLHQLIYKCLLRRRERRKLPVNVLALNSLTSPFLWALTLITVIPAVLFWQNVWALRIFFFIFVIFYLVIYKRLKRY
jgi:UDP-N-acetylmuramyl pentapeptide phosphotransferase/UDP-N-acetylglucosamine-1-phosphate transferase